MKTIREHFAAMYFINKKDGNKIIYNSVAQMGQVRLQEQYQYLSEDYFYLAIITINNNTLPTIQLYLIYKRYTHCSAQEFAQTQLNKLFLYSHSPTTGKRSGTPASHRQMTSTSSLDRQFTRPSDTWFILQLQTMSPLSPYPTNHDLQFINHRPIPLGHGGLGDKRTKLSFL